MTTSRNSGTEKDEDDKVELMVKCNIYDDKGELIME